MPRAAGKTANIRVARVLPLILTGIVGYVTWVVTVEVCVKYLLQAKLPYTPRPGAAAVILVLYYLLLVLMAWAYFRLLYTVTVNPGYVGRSTQWIKNQSKNSSKRGRGQRSDKPDQASEKTVVDSDHDGRNPPHRLEDGPSLQPFISRPAYICQGNGRPLWCSSCQNWKPDRTHHCRECDRCVRKMDHFCPWVGGVVSETSFKFFVQFVGWTSLFCCLVLVHLAVFLAEQRRRSTIINVHYIVSLALAALFGAFATGMTGASLKFVFSNLTTIEDLSRKTVVHQIAVHLPQPPTKKPPYSVVSFSMSNNSIRTFAILRTQPGQNVWDLGWRRNFQDVMGFKWYDWILPIRMSPCSVHDLENAEFSMGPVIQDLLKEAKTSRPAHSDTPARRKKRRRRRTRRIEGNG